MTGNTLGKTTEASAKYSYKILASFSSVVLRTKVAYNTNITGNSNSLFTNNKKRVAKLHAERERERISENTDEHTSTVRTNT